MVATTGAPLALRKRYKIDHAVVVVGTTAVGVRETKLEGTRQGKSLGSHSVDPEVPRRGNQNKEKR